MFKSKKANTNILINLFVMMVFSVILIIGIIFAYILFAAGHDYAILTLYDAAVGSDPSAEIQAGFESTVEAYRAFDINSISDNIWLFSYLSMSMIAFVAAYSGRKTGIFSFLSMLTYGLIFILYLFSFFLIILQWLYFDILLNLFINLVPSLPMLEYFVNHGGIFMLVQASLLLLISTIDLDFSSWGARNKKERAIFDNEIL